MLVQLTRPAGSQALLAKSRGWEAARTTDENVRAADVRMRARRPHYADGVDAAAARADHGRRGRTTVRLYVVVDSGRRGTSPLRRRRRYALQQQTVSARPTGRLGDRTAETWKRLIDGRQTCSAQI